MFTPVRESGGRSLAHRVERTADRRFIRRVCDQTKIMLPDQVSRIAADQPQNRPAGRDVSLKLGRNRQIKFRLQRDDQYIGFRKIFRHLLTGTPPGENDVAKAVVNRLFLQAVQINSAADDAQFGIGAVPLSESVNDLVQILD